MGFELERQILEGQFLTIWTAAGTPCGVQWDAVPFTPTSGLAYVRITILNGDSFPASIGGEMGRNIGLFVVDVFSPEETGSSAPRKICDIIKTGMSLKTLNSGVSNVRLWQTRAQRMPAGVDGGYHIRTETPFVRDDQQ